MNNRMKYIKSQRQWALAAGGLGLLLALLGVALPGLFGDLHFNTRIVTGLGILLMGIGLASWLRYLSLRRDTPEVARMLNERFDERAAVVRLRAGNRAFWVMLPLAYIGLMWVSFAANGSLPPMSEDALWWFLAALVVLPFGVYAVSLALDKG